MNYKLNTYYKKLLADTLTPVNIYLKVRDVFAGSILLESSDYHGRENSLSLICCEPIASFEVQNGKVQMQFPDGAANEIKIERGKTDLPQLLDDFKNSFNVEANGNFKSFCLFGYTAYNAFSDFECCKIEPSSSAI